MGFFDRFVRRPDALPAVTMINSVDEYVAGLSYMLDPETADRFILCGYASGDLSREYTEAERDAMQSRTQVVAL